MKLVQFVQLGLFVGLGIHTSASGIQKDIDGDDISLSTRGLLSGIKDVTTCAGCEVIILSFSNCNIISDYELRRLQQESHKHEL